jgi:hypothetical protein
LKTLEGTLLHRPFIKRLVNFLVVMTIFLIITDIVFAILNPTGSYVLNFEFDIDNEANWTTWFNSTLDLLAGLVAFLVAWVVLNYTNTKARRWTIAGWVFTGLIFVYLSMDDTSTLHETLNRSFQHFLEQHGMSISTLGALLWANLWVLILGIPGIIVALLMLRFLYRNIWKVPQARWLIVAGFVLLASNPITEIAEGKSLEHLDSIPSIYDLYFEHPQEWRMFKVFNLVQEGTELFAVICFMASFLLAGEALLTGSSQNVLTPVRPQNIEEVNPGIPLGNTLV